MKTGTRSIGPASLRVRRSNALPHDMQASTREIANLEVPAGQQRQGYGTTLMHKVCREADAAGIVLILWPAPYGDAGMNLEQLGTWYADEFGFSAIQTEPMLMARLPDGTPRKLRLSPVVEAVVLSAE